MVDKIPFRKGDEKMSRFSDKEKELIIQCLKKSLALNPLVKEVK
jgi:hypothetical protein